VPDQPARGQYRAGVQFEQFHRPPQPFDDGEGGVAIHQQRVWRLDLHHLWRKVARQILACRQRTAPGRRRQEAEMGAAWTAARSAFEPYRLDRRHIRRQAPGMPFPSAAEDRKIGKPMIS
jgi:hypothetical protein